MPGTGQLVQARGDRRDPGAELLRELAALRRVSRLGERPVHRQPQVLTVHTAILPKPGPAS